ncbi:IgGFc-binding protein-like [Amphiura filiformis]|uniref:IgGFc-binding protein-like n=1 Tax=Amphiura filiformis TaxID=82378 RepID=UPI003B212B05
MATTMFHFGIIIFTCLTLCVDFATTQGRYYVVDSKPEQRTNAGTKFVFALSENYSLRHNATLVITNKSPLDTRVNITYNRKNIIENLAIPMGKHKTVYLPNDVVLKKTDGITVQNGIAVISDNDVIVQVYNDVHHRSMDGFLALPTHALGTEYYIITYSPWIQSQFALVATEDDTEIYFTPAQPYQFARRTIVPAGSRIKLTANQFEAIQLQCPECDFSGARINSNKPIAVISGNRCASVPEDIQSCDHLVEQLPPVNQWGKTFIAAPLMGRPQASGNRFRILAARYGTEIGVGADSVSLKPGEYHDFQLAANETTLVVSNKPILTAQFCSGFEADNITGDPAMTLVPSLEQRVNEATFVTYNKTKEQTEVTNFITVHADCTDFEDILLDGRQMTSIPDVEFTTVELTDYCIGSIEVARKGMHSIIGDTNTTMFSAILYGFAYYNSFAHPIAMGLKDTLCRSPLPGISDIVEHDCEQQLITVQLPCMEVPNETLIECDYTECVKPVYVIAIAVGCVLVAIMIETLIRTKLMVRENYVDKHFYTPRELYHRKAVVRKQHRDSNQVMTLYNK